MNGSTTRRSNFETENRKMRHPRLPARVGRGAALAEAPDLEAVRAVLGETASEAMTDIPQPQPGDVLLGCKHRPNIHASHVFQVKTGLPFTRPDGSSATATWIFICDNCFKKHVIDGDGLASSAPLSCDMTWKAHFGKLTFRKTS